MKLPALVLVLCLAAGAGCGPSKSAISPAQRKEAANLFSEAEFAITLRDWKRAEGLFDRTVKICPDIGDYWMALGTTRMRLGRRAEARGAYQKAIDAYEDEAAAARTDSRPALQQVVAFALLGRVDEARNRLTKLSARFPKDSAVTAFVVEKQLDAMLADPKFKELAL